eukprot:2761046-Rhodomonas_salina.1
MSCTGGGVEGAGRGSQPRCSALAACDVGGEQGGGSSAESCCSWARLGVPESNQESVREAMLVLHRVASACEGSLRVLCGVRWQSARRPHSLTSPLPPPSPPAPLRATRRPASSPYNMHYQLVRLSRSVSTAQRWPSERALSLVPHSAASRRNQTQQTTPEPALILSTAAAGVLRDPRHATKAKATQMRVRSQISGWNRAFDFRVQRRARPGPRTSAVTWPPPGTALLSSVPIGCTGCGLCIGKARRVGYSGCARVCCYDLMAIQLVYSGTKDSLRTMDYGIGMWWYERVGPHIVIDCKKNVRTYPWDERWSRAQVNVLAQG